MGNPTPILLTLLSTRKHTSAVQPTGAQRSMEEIDKRIVEVARSVVNIP